MRLDQRIENPAIRAWLRLQTMAALGYNPLVAITIALRGNAVECLNQDNELPVEPPDEQLLFNKSGRQE